MRKTIAVNPSTHGRGGGRPVNTVGEAERISGVSNNWRSRAGSGWGAYDVPSPKSPAPPKALPPASSGWSLASPESLRARR